MGQDFEQENFENKNVDNFAFNINKEFEKFPSPSFFEKLMFNNDDKTGDFGFFR